MAPFRFITAAALTAVLSAAALLFTILPRSEGRLPDDGRVIVGVVADADPAPIDDALAAAGAGVTLRIDQLHVLAVQGRPGGRDDLIARLERLPAVRYAAPDGDRYQLMSAPSDPAYQAGDQWNIDKVQAPQAWDLLPSGATTLVAVLDTGIDYNHPEFAGRISPAGCDEFHGGCSSHSGARPQDLNGHGTHVAGIIGAATNNGVGVASVSGGRVTILPVQVLSVGGGVVKDSTIINSIVYAVDQGAKVINMSFGGACGSEVDPAEREAIDYAEAHGVLLVMSAGNSGGCREGRFPQNDPRVISVAATDRSDDGATFTDRGLYVSVAAPGVRILSTVPLALGGYAVFSGTSMAAPHVTAEAALLFQVPGATKDKVVRWITSTCDSANVSATCGGRINVYRAVSLAMTGIDPGASAVPAGTPTPAPSPTPTVTPSPTPAPILPPEATPAPTPEATLEPTVASAGGTLRAGRR